MAGVQISCLAVISSIISAVISSIIFIWQQIILSWLSCKFMPIQEGSGISEHVKNSTQWVHKCVLNCCSWTQCIFSLFLVGKKNQGLLELLFTLWNVLYNHSARWRHHGNKRTAIRRFKDSSCSCNILITSLMLAVEMFCGLHWLKPVRVLPSNHSDLSRFQLD